MPKYIIGYILASLLALGFTFFVTWMIEKITGNSWLKSFGIVMLMYTIIAILIGLIYLTLWLLGVPDA